MSFDKTTHDLHQRRFGRNLGVALILVSFIALVFGLTMVKVTSPGFKLPTAEVVNG